MAHKVERDARADAIIKTAIWVDDSVAGFYGYRSVTATSGRLVSQRASETPPCATSMLRLAVRSGATRR